MDGLRSGWISHPWIPSIVVVIRTAAAGVFFSAGPPMDTMDLSVHTDLQLGQTAKAPLNL